MTKKVIGWDWYDGDDFTGLKHDDFTDEVWDAVLTDVKKHGYLFTGEDQQETPYCCPVLNNYRIARFSRRGFARIMAQANGEMGDYDYARYMEREFIAEKDKVIPDGKANEDERKKDRTWAITLKPNDFETVVRTIYEMDAVEYGYFYYLQKDEAEKNIMIPMPYDENAPTYWKGDMVAFYEEGTRRTAQYSAIRRILAFDDLEEYEEWAEWDGDLFGAFVFVGDSLEKVAKQGKFILVEIG